MSDFLRVVGDTDAFNLPEIQNAHAATGNLKAVTGQRPDPADLLTERIASHAIQQRKSLARSYSSVSGYFEHFLYGGKSLAHLWLAWLFLCCHTKCPSSFLDSLQLRLLGNREYYWVDFAGLFQCHESEWMERESLRLLLPHQASYRSRCQTCAAVGSQDKGWSWSMRRCGL